MLVTKPQTKRQLLESLRGQLELERSSFLQSWRDCNDFVAPRRARFTLSDVNRGDRRNQRIIDNTATLALRTLVSGMMSGVTSPARPWFRLSTQDEDLAEFGPVKAWLHAVTTRMTTIFLRSNLYNVLPTLYKDLGGFGTSSMGVEEDFRKVVRFFSFPVGSYCLATNDQQVVDTICREFNMTVRQVIQKFGKIDPRTGAADWSNISNHVKSLWDNGNSQAWVTIQHFITPNENYDGSKLLSKFKKFESTYYERGVSTNQNANYLGTEPDRYLSEMGYDMFPILAPRWEVTGEDTYATEWPALVGLGDTKQLQVGERRSMQAVDKMVNPPMVAPTVLKSQKVSILPGDTTYVDVNDRNQGFRPAHEVNPRVMELEQKQQQVRQRIDKAFYADLFLMMTELDRSDITATEVVERREEKLLALGPVLEQLNQDVLDPLIDNTFNIMLKQNLVPPPPPDLQGQELKVVYTSIMAQAQKLIGISGVERVTNFVVQLSASNPSVMNKLDTNQTIDIYADMAGTPPGMIRSNEDADAILQQQQQAAAQAQKAAMAKDASAAAKNLSQSDLNSDNALSRLTSGLNHGEVQQ